MMLVSLDCSFLIALSVFSNVYIELTTLLDKLDFTKSYVLWVDWVFPIYVQRVLLNSVMMSGVSLMSSVSGS